MSGQKKVRLDAGWLCIIAALIGLSGLSFYSVLRSHRTASVSPVRQTALDAVDPGPSSGAVVTSTEIHPQVVVARLDITTCFARDIAATNADLALAMAMKRMAASDSDGLVAWVKGVLQQGGGFEGLDAPHIAGAAVEALLDQGNLALARRAVEQWTQIPGGPQIGNNTFEAVALDIAKASQTDAMTWLLSLPAGNDRNYAMTTLAAVWVKSDPKAAMDWAAQLPGADGRDNVMERAFNQWAQDNETSARQWLNGHLSDPDAEKMVVSMVVESGLSYSNPQEAIVWADMISDPAVRLESVEDVFLAWVRRDPDAAANYIKDDPTLTASEKKEVLDSFYGWKNMGATN